MEWHMSRCLETSGKSSHVQVSSRFVCQSWYPTVLPSPHAGTAATSPVGSPGSVGAAVESTTSEPSTEVAGTPPEEQTTRYAE